MNFPHERAKLYKLIRDTKAAGVVFLSGDRHLAELSMMEGDVPPDRLLGSLQQLPAEGATSAPSWQGIEAWFTVDELERGARRRRAGLAAAGAGSVSAAVLGLAALGSFGLGGGTPAAQLGGVPSATPSPVQLPAVAHVHGRLPGWSVQRDPRTAATSAVLVQE